MQAEAFELELKEVLAGTLYLVGHFGNLPCFVIDQIVKVFELHHKGGPF